MDSFPNTVDKFVSKYNKRNKPYVVCDEVLNLVNGQGEKELDHDNVTDNSVEVWTGPSRTGSMISSHTVDKPSDALWKTVVKINNPADLSRLEKVYITYETSGDQVEADDINNVQKSLVSTQFEVLKHQADTTIHIMDGIIDGGNFGDLEENS